MKQVHEFDRLVQSWYNHQSSFSFQHPMMHKPKTWSQAYPQGSLAGNEEQRFFIGKDGKSGLVRSPKHKYRSTEALVRESGLSHERTEQIINKYVKMGLVFAHPSNPNHWCYWERDPSVLEKPKSLAASDQTERMNKSSN